MYNSFGRRCRSTEYYSPITRRCRSKKNRPCSPQLRTGLLRARNESNVCVVKKSCRSPTKRELINYIRQVGIPIELGKKLKDGPGRTKRYSQSVPASDAELKRRITKAGGDWRTIVRGWRNSKGCYVVRSAFGTKLSPDLVTSVQSILKKGMAAAAKDADVQLDEAESELLKTADATDPTEVNKIQASISSDPKSIHWAIETRAKAAGLSIAGPAARGGGGVSDRCGGECGADGFVEDAGGDAAASGGGC